MKPTPTPSAVCACKEFTPAQPSNQPTEKGDAVDIHDVCDCTMMELCDKCRPSKDAISKSPTAENPLHNLVASIKALSREDFRELWKQAGCDDLANAEATPAAESICPKCGVLYYEDHCSHLDPSITWKKSAESGETPRTDAVATKAHQGGDYGGVRAWIESTVPAYEMAKIEKELQSTKAANEALAQRCALLEEALHEYGQHYDSCSWHLTFIGQKRDCNCGYLKTLTQPERKNDHE
jgi:hypothetical protein